jgi:hypothetical protein
LDSGVFLIFSEVWFTSSEILGFAKSANFVKVWKNPSLVPEAAFPPALPYAVIILLADEP